MRVKRQTRQCQRTRSDFRLRAGRVKKGGEQKGCFGFRNRIRVERPSDIAGRQLVSTRVLKESSQNFAEFQRNVLIAAFCVVLTIPGRHFLPNSFACGNPGCWRILAVCGIRRLATRDWFARPVFFAQRRFSDERCDGFPGPESCGAADTDAIQNSSAG